MKFEFTGYNDDGTPSHVSTDNGFVQTSRPFNPEKDGWMLDQLHNRDFPIIQLGRDVEYLVKEVNDLRRELYCINLKI